MSQSWCCAGCGTWNWGSRSSCHYCGQLMRTSNGNSWSQVAKRGKTSGKGKGAHVKQQYHATQAVTNPDAYANGEKLVNVKQLHVRIAAVSKALTELEGAEDKRIDATSRIPPVRPESQATRSKTEWTTSRWASWSHFEVSKNALPKRRSPKRKPKPPLSKRRRTLRATKPSLQSSNHSSPYLRGFEK